MSSSNDKAPKATSDSHRQKSKTVDIRVKSHDGATSRPIPQSGRQGQSTTYRKPDGPAAHKEHALTKSSGSSGGYTLQAARHPIPSDRMKPAPLQGNENKQISQESEPEKMVLQSLPPHKSTLQGVTDSGCVMEREHFLMKSSGSSGGYTQQAVMIQPIPGDSLSPSVTQCHSVQMEEAGGKEEEGEEPDTDYQRYLGESQSAEFVASTKSPESQCDQVNDEEEDEEEPKRKANIRVMSQSPRTTGREEPNEALKEQVKYLRDKLDTAERDNRKLWEEKTKLTEQVAGLGDSSLAGDLSVALGFQDVRSRKVLVSTAQKLRKICQETNQFKQNLTRALGFRYKEVDDQDILVRSSNLDAENRELKGKVSDQERERQRLTESLEERNQSRKSLISALGFPFEPEDKDIISRFSKLDRENKDLGRMKTKMSELERERQQLTERVSQMMYDRVSQDESRTENINDPNRPSKIAEQWVHFTTNEWVEALDAMKVGTSEDDEVAEKRNMKALGRLIMVSWNAARVTFDRYKERRVLLLTEPVLSSLNTMPGLSSLQETAMDIDGEDQPTASADPRAPQAQSRRTAQDKSGGADKAEEKKFSQQLLSALLNQIKARSDDTNIQPLVELVTEEARKDDIIRAVIALSLFQNPGPFRDFLNALCRLSWKMVIQQPQLTLSTDGCSKPYDKTTQELSYLCHNSPGAVVAHYTKPTLYHGQKRLHKGEVFLTKPSN